MDMKLAQGHGHTKRLGQLEPGSLLESIPDFAFLFGTQGDPIAANSAAMRMLGKSRKEFSRMSQQEVLDLLRIDNPAKLSNSIVTKTAAGESIRHMRSRVVRQDTGGAIDLSISTSPICNDRGEVAGVLMVAHDVTELTMLQRRIAESERHHTIGQMAAALAHDFNNVLDTIGQAAAVLEMAKQSKERREMIQIIRMAVRRGAEIILGVREYLRTGIAETGPVDIRQVLIETVELTRPLWQRAGVHLATDLQAVANVVADAADLRRVFTNLIINAIEAMPHGGELTITCSEAGGKVTASIRDTGMGIAPEHQGRIFFPYFTTKPQGTGLGLSGAQKILLGLGGGLRFASDPGKGTTFTLELPVQKRQKNGNGEHQSAA